MTGQSRVITFIVQWLMVLAAEKRQHRIIMRWGSTMKRQHSRWTLGYTQLPAVGVTVKKVEPWVDRDCFRD
jgi:hypothetical protein